MRGSVKKFVYTVNKFVDRIFERLYDAIMGFDIEKMRSLQEQLGLTDQQAAERAGMANRQQWNAIKAGRNSPTIETLEKIAAALGVKAKDLLK